MMDRRRKYDARQKAAGLVRVEAWVPLCKRDQFKAYSKRLRTSYLKNQKGAA